MGLGSGKNEVERLVPKPGEKTPEESYEDQKAKVNGFLSRCLQSRKEKQRPLISSPCMFVFVCLFLSLERRLNQNSKSFSWNTGKW